MSAHERFHYNTLEELKKRAEELGVTIPFAADTKILGTTVSFGNVTLPNRLGTAPMEGADALPNGAPSEFTKGETAPMSIDSARIVIDSMAGKTEHTAPQSKKAKGLPPDRQTGPELPVIEE